MLKTQRPRRRLLLAGAVLVAVCGCQSPQSLATFARDFAREVLAAFLL